MPSQLKDKGHLGWGPHAGEYIGMVILAGDHMQVSILAWHSWDVSPCAIMVSLQGELLLCSSCEKGS